jgi:hypothetical protein
MVVKVGEINGLRGSVVMGYTYWERLKINLVFIKPGEVMATVEGFYATGAGDHLPATSAYKYIDNDYPVHFKFYKSNVVRRFATTINVKQIRYETICS